MWVAFAFAKNTSELDIALARTVNILPTNELVKLTMLWTTGPWLIPIKQMSQNVRNRTVGYVR